MNRNQRFEIAKDTVDIVRNGSYQSPSGAVIHLKNDILHAVENTKLYRPNEIPEVRSGEGTFQTHMEVTSETTLEAAERIASENAVCLNFASAKNPGGGFLGGSQAQEESLARSSALYACISSQLEMYEHNRKMGTCLYSDYMLYSPGVPVFRNDEGELLEQPYKIAFITAPAVNAGAVRKNEPHNVSLIRSTMERRAKKILWLAADHQYSTLVLGAWGCGVFGNEPQMVAEIFANLLTGQGEYRGCFPHIVFAVYDTSPNKEALNAFEITFG